MSLLRRLRPLLLALVTIAAAAQASLAADPAADTAKPASSSTKPEYTDRLFLAFFQEASLVPSQWWEGQLEYSNGGHDFPVDAFVARGVVAFRPVKTLEVGGRVGFGTTSANGNEPDGSGATDLDIYGKWLFPDVASNLDVSVGALFTIPTGDNTAGLGLDTFSSQLFGGINYRLETMAFGGHLGVRLNGDGSFQNSGTLHGKASIEMGLSAVFKLASQVSIIGEAQLETDRYDEADSTAQLLAGINWRAFNRGVFRGALAFGLSDGAPDYRVMLGYAYTF